MSKGASNRSRDWDFVWYAAGRVSAAMIAITSIALVMSAEQQESDSKARAIAVRQQYVAAHQRKVPWTPPLRELAESAETRP